MQITYEINADGDSVKVTTTDSGTVIREIDRPALPPAADPCLWLIDIGPFFDRFGATKMSVLTSPDTSVKAILADLQVRHWVDLKRPDVTQALAYVGSVVAAVTPAVQSAVMTTPVRIDENLVLRKMYF